MISSSRGLAAPSVTFGDDARAARLVVEHCRLSRSLSNYTSTHPVIAPLGPDPLMEQLTSAKGFTKVDLAILRVIANGTCFTVVGVPTRIWRNPEDMSDLLAIKHEAAACGTKCVLAPQRSLRTGVRAKVAKTLAMSNRVRIRREHAEAIELHLHAIRVATLEECAAQLNGHEDPIGAVLALCARGRLLIDRSKPITLKSLVASKNTDSPEASSACSGGGAS